MTSKLDQLIWWSNFKELLILCETNICIVNSEIFLVPNSVKNPLNPDEIREERLVTRRSGFFDS